MELAEAFRRWAAETTRSPGTVSRYTRGVMAVARHGLATVEGITRTSVVAFQDARRAAGVGARTINGDLAGVLAVFKWLVKRGELSLDRLVELRATRLEEPRPAPPDAYTDAEYHRMVETIRHPIARRAFKVACLSGLRISELRRLRREDFDLTRRVLRVRGRTKSHRERSVAICRELAELVAPLPEGPLFPALRKRTPQRDPFVSVSFLEVAITSTGFGLGIVASVHKCRRTFVTRALLASVPPSEVARMAGHDLKVMIARYAAWIDRYEPAIEGLSYHRSTGT